MIHDISFYDFDGCELELPTAFNDCLSPEQQILWLFLHKQDLLEAGDGVTLTRLPDGNVRISIEGGTGGGSEYTMVKVAHPSSGNIAEYRLRDVTAGSYKGDIIEIPEGEQGRDGVGITSIVFKSEDIDGNYIYTVNLSDNTHYDITAPRGPEGERGATGSQGPQGERGPAGETGPQGPQGIQGIQGPAGQDGTNGTDGVSPTASVTAIPGGHEVSITDAQGTNTFNVMDGQDGEGNRIWYTLSNYATPNYTFDISDLTGVSGETPMAGDYVIQYYNSRTILYYVNTVGSTTVACTDICDLTGATGPAGATGPQGPQGIQGIQGPAGQDGTDGTDGVSPTITVTAITGGHTVSITDAQGTNTFNVMDGVNGTNGTNGTDGVSPTVSVTSITGGHEVEITDAQGTTSFNVMDGVDGQQGPQGPAGQNGTNGTDGVSPSVTVTQITGGHQVSITDAQGTDTFNVMDGVDGQQGQTGPAGPGVPTGGTAGQVLSKVDGTDYNTQWVNPPSGGMNTDGSNAANHVRFSGAFSVGTRNGTVGTNSMTVGDTSASGQDSFSQGLGGGASGKYAHSEGYNSSASGEGAHAEGSSSASGYYSHAEGASNAKADYSHAEGSGTIAGTGRSYGQNSHAEGVSTKTYGTGSHAEGNNTIAGIEGTTSYGSAAHAEGRYTLASGNYSHAEGEGDSTTKVRALGQGSHAEGYKTTTTGTYSHAEGRETETIGPRSHAEGSYTKTGISGISSAGESAHAEGYYTVASGEYSHAEGSGDSTTPVTASGISSHAEGYKTTASGNSSHAEGNGSVASGANSHAGGEGGVAVQADQFAFGGLTSSVLGHLGFGFGCGCHITAQNYSTDIDGTFGAGGVIDYLSSDTTVRQRIKIAPNGIYLLVAGKTYSPDRPTIYNTKIWLVTDREVFLWLDRTTGDNMIDPQLAFDNTDDYLTILNRSQGYTYSFQLIRLI